MDGQSLPYTVLYQSMLRLKFLFDPHNCSVHVGHGLHNIQYILSKSACIEISQIVPV